MGLIEICNFADEFSLLFNPKLGLCSQWKLTHFFTAVMFLLVGRAWETKSAVLRNFSNLTDLIGQRCCKKLFQQAEISRVIVKPIYQRIWYRFFFLMRITFIRAEIEVQQSEKKQHRLQAIHVDQIFYYRRRHTSPHLTNIITFCKSSQLMCHPVERPFQVPYLPATKPTKKSKNSMDNMAHFSFDFLG